MYLFIYLYLLFINPLVYLFIFYSIIDWFIYLLILFIYLLIFIIHKSVGLFIYYSIILFIYLFVYLFPSPILNQKQDKHNNLFC